jgi:DNA polymerase delta subunit 2
VGQLVALVGPADAAGIYPFPDADPFIIHHRPHVYVIGNQPEFETALVGGELTLSRSDVEADTTDPSSPTRIVLLPSFAQTGTLALVCLETLECKTVEFEVPVWEGEVNGHVKDEIDGEDGDVKIE